MNKKFTFDNQTLKNGEELLNLFQVEGLKTLMHYVRTFNTYLNLILMKRGYACKMMFIHSLQPWAHTLILQRSEVLRTYQEIMKVAKCMEKKIIFCKNNDGQRGHPKGGLKGVKKNKGEKVPHKGKKIPWWKKFKRWIEQN